MDAELWERVKRVFDDAVDLPSAERLHVLDSACASDPALRAEVERLLAEYDRSEGFLDSPVVQAAPSLAAGAVIGERYEIVRLMGRGGMGEVYEARDRVLGESVALKTLRPELAGNRAVLERFRKEILAARKVTHPNVCRVFEVGSHDGAQYFTMELLEGETLDARIKREGRIAAVEAIPLIRQMALGLDAAHRAGIIHRDFKSSNVMLSGDRAVITDFGLARGAPRAAAAAATGDGSTIGQMAGTLGYMSPEQLTGGTVTAASDIYSFGIVLFEMAAGKLPFDGTHVINSAVQRASGQIPWIRNEVPDIDPRWESAIGRCLQPEPAKRFGSAAEIVEHFARPAFRNPFAGFAPRRSWLAAAGAIAAAVAAYVYGPSRGYVPKQEALEFHERGVQSIEAMTYESGRRALEKAVSLDPDYAPSRAYLAAAWSEIDNQRAARDEMLKAVSAMQRKRPGSEDTLRVEAIQHVIAREFDAARPLFTRLVHAARSDREKASAWLQLAWLEQKRQDLPATVKCLEEALRLNPSSAAAKLRMAMVHGNRQEIDKANEAFREAEALFQAASMSEGVTETLWQQSRILARTRRAAEALPLIERGRQIAVSTSDFHHELRLRLAEASVHRALGDTGRSLDLARQAVKIAAERGMDAVAAVGSVDMGSAYLIRDQPKEAEEQFQRGLEFAVRGDDDYTEARAALSLGSLRVQYNHADEAIPWIERSLKFFREAGRNKEAMQALLLLGGARTGSARYKEAEEVLREALRLAEQLRDREQQGLSHWYLGEVLEQTGRWPGADAEYSRALEFVGDLRGGYHTAQVLPMRARLRAQLGRFDDAAADIREGLKWAAKISGAQNQVKSRLALAEAEMAYIRSQWGEARAHAERAAGLRGGDAESGQAALLAALTRIRSGDNAGAGAAVAAIERLDVGKHEFVAARARLWLAEAMQARGLDGVPHATRALAFFEARENHEAMWRCRRALGSGVEHVSASQAALSELKRSWPADAAAAYLGRPDLRTKAE